MGWAQDRTTDNMTWGEFIHFTARPVDGIPDPHLHANCFVFNVTMDEEEERWKAGQFAGLKKGAPYFEAMFHSRLARQFQKLGLPVERTKRGWELRDMPTSMLRKYSRRIRSPTYQEHRGWGMVPPKRPATAPIVPRRHTGQVHRLVSQVA